MDYAAKINEMKSSKKTLVEKAEALVAEGKAEEVVAINDQIKNLNQQIQAIEDLAAQSASNAKPIPAQVKDNKPHTPFANLGEQLRAIHAAKTKGIIDSRLLEVNNAVTGSAESTGPDGGFAIQEDFAGKIMESAVSTGEILSRVDSYTVGAGSNAARWLMIDETDVTASVFGGVQMYWASEGATVLASKPKFKEMKLDLEKMMGFAYATDELLQDATFMTGFYGTAFSLAGQRLLEGSIVEGDGVGKPLGILKSKALVTVAKESGQEAGSVQGENLLKMYGRFTLKNRRNSVWLMHPDLEMDLPKLYLTLGSDSKSIWMPEGGISGAQYQTIFGRPIIFDDNCAAKGSAGDIILADLKQYMLLKKGTAKQDWSMHVEFLTDQMCFRIVFRCNGAPKLDAPSKLKNSNSTRSPFVTLAARA